MQRPTHSLPHHSMTPCYQVRTSKTWIYPEMYLYYIFSGETVLKKTRRGSRDSLWEKIAIDWTLNMENLSLTQFSCQNVQCGCVCSVTSVRSDSVTLWTTARQTLLPIGFPRQEYWSGLTFPSPGIESAFVSYIGRWILYSCAIWEARWQK